ncbi:MAG: eL32 family ribosomal protein [Candidatus Diapherotrites archaeon]
MAEKEKKKEKKPVEAKKELKKEEKKTETKEAAKEKKEEQKQVKPKAKRRAKVNDKILELREEIKKKWKPTFRGRWGKKWLRRPSKKKWDKWRHPRGIDIKRKKEDGALPKSGYRTAGEIRGLHPSGFRERMVKNSNELNSVKEGEAIRIAAAVGRKKRKEIRKKAKEMNLYILN